MTQHTLKKAERLTGKIAVDELFASGKSFFLYPYRITYSLLEDDKQDYPCRVLINVPKRLHKTAVARNLLKRRIKEAYRLDKNDFYTQLNGKSLHLAIIYTSDKVLPYDELSQKLKGALTRLLKQLA